MSRLVLALQLIFFFMAGFTWQAKIEQGAIMGSDVDRLDVLLSSYSLKELGQIKTRSL